jgi:hypothetical protein
MAWSVKACPHREPEIFRSSTVSLEFPPREEIPVSPGARTGSRRRAASYNCYQMRGIGRNVSYLNGGEAVRLVFARHRQTANRGIGYWTEEPKQ